MDEAGADRAGADWASADIASAVIAPAVNNLLMAFPSDPAANPDGGIMPRIAFLTIMRANFDCGPIVVAG
jgi:hypothetical protein